MTGLWGFTYIHCVYYVGLLVLLCFFFPAVMYCLNFFLNKHYFKGIVYIMYLTFFSDHIFPYRNWKVGACLKKLILDPDLWSWPFPWVQASSCCRTFHWASEVVVAEDWHPASFKQQCKGYCHIKDIHLLKRNTAVDFADFFSAEAVVCFIAAFAWKKLLFECLF